jgi:hypothetical protein
MIEAGRGSVEKRACERFPEKVPVDFYYDSIMYEGIVTNLSRNGLHIDAEICPPFESNLEVVLILGDEVFNLPSKVKRLVSRDTLSCSIGVEIPFPSESYCEFVSTVQDYFHQSS